MFFIYPYMTGSKSVKKLKELLEGKIIKLEGSRYRPKSDHIIINYGNSREPDWLTDDANIINHHDKVAVASSKIKTFITLEEAGVPTVPFTTDTGVAADWAQEGHKVFVRHKDNGHSGEGIEVITPREVEGFTDEQIEEINRLEDYLELAESNGYNDIAEVINVRIDNISPSITIEPAQIPEAPLYTRGIPNAGEYRVHVVNGEVILYQKKSRRVDEDGNVITPEGEEADVRNLASNWVYRTGNLRRLDRVEQLAINAIDALDLDFGAVDIIKDENGDVFVLEINTAPGLGNTETQEAYKKAFLKLAGIETEDELELEWY